MGSFAKHVPILCSGGVPAALGASTAEEFSEGLESSSLDMIVQYDKVDNIYSGLEIGLDGPNGCAVTQKEESNLRHPLPKMLSDFVDTYD